MSGLDKILFDVSQMMGITLPRVVAALAGIILCVWLVYALWSRRLRPVVGILGLLAGAFLVAIAVDTRLLHWLVNADHLIHIRLIMALLSLVVVTVTFEAIRRSHLQERYALLWVIAGLLILLSAAFPGLLGLISLALHVQYVTSMVIVVFSFLLLVTFHFSISLSGLQDDRARLAQRCAQLEARLRDVEAQLGLLPSPPSKDVSSSVVAPAHGVIPEARQSRGARMGAWAIIALAVLSVLGLGLMATEPMIGDEVTHYYMAVEQGKTLPIPHFFASIPNGWGDPEVRCYPHPNLWHYLAGAIHRVSSGSFRAVQVFHAFFWFQLLWVAYRLAKSRGGIESRSALLYVILIASLPMALMFSVALYQDVPLAAQALTAFYLLSRRKFIASAVFMGLALGMKVNGALFIPPYFVLLVLQLRPARGSSFQQWSIAALRGVACTALVGGALWGVGWSLKKYGGAEYYPLTQIRHGIEHMGRHGGTPALPHPAPAGPTHPSSRVRSPQQAEIIANHPGDLRIPSNFLVYGGALIWLALAAALAGRVRRYFRPAAFAESPSSVWLWVTGLFYIGVSGWTLRTAPDARFFLPGVVFLLLPIAEEVVRLPRSRLLLIFAAALGLLQGGQVLAKVGHLRAVSPDLKEAIEYLRGEPPAPQRILMYPEGNYRLFPVRHEWYLDYRLRDFWRANNDQRIEMLHQFHIGAIVVKKHLIRPVDAHMTDLGCYPDFFVHQLGRDARFEKCFENAAVLIYRVPPEESPEVPDAPVPPSKGIPE